MEHLHSRPCPVRTSSSNYLACGGLFRAYAGLGSSEKRPPQMILKFKIVYSSVIFFVKSLFSQKKLFPEIDVTKKWCKNI